jgi:hypothetical protein
VIGNLGTITYGAWFPPDFNSNLVVLQSPALGRHILHSSAFCSIKTGRTDKGDIHPFKATGA